MLTLLADIQSSTPNTVSWSFSVGVIMLICNLFSIAIGRYAIQNRGAGPDLPFPKPSLFASFGVPELLATVSLGHILGTGVILGLANAGVL